MPIVGNGRNHCGYQANRESKEENESRCLPHRSGAGALVAFFHALDKKVKEINNEMMKERPRRRFRA